MHLHITLKKQMKKPRKHTSLLILFFFTSLGLLLNISLLFPQTDKENTIPQNEQSIDWKSPKAASNHAPISLNGDAELEAFCMGSGTEADPYIIEDYIINASTGHGINLSNTNAHLTIRNCTIFDENFMESFDGIHIEYCENVKMENNELTNTGRGIYLRSSSNNILSGNNCSNNEWDGIFLRESTNNTLLSNNCSNNLIWSPTPGNYNGGIHLSSSSNNNTLSDNKCSANILYGIILEGSSNNNTLSDNNCSNNGVGIQLRSSSNSNTLSGNNCSNNEWDGIYLISSSNNTLLSNNCSNNIWDPSPGHYFGGIYLSSSSNNNTLSDNKCSANTMYGIILDGSSYNSLSDNNCSNNTEDGVYLSSSSNNTLLSNNCSNNTEDGVYLSSSSNNTLSDNKCSANTMYGIILDGSSNNTLLDNNCSNNTEDGVYLSSSNNNTLSGNNCSNNYNGIVFDGSSNYNNITGNVAMENSEDGIHLENSSSNKILGNNCSANLNNGIKLKSSANLNTIWKNNFFGNMANQTNCTSDCENNQWYSGETGNYYGDYLDQNPDAQDIGGIWDMPYHINGTTSDTDPYPLVNMTKDITPPMWNPTPEDQTIDEGEDLSYQISATDDIAIDEYWVNDTVNFAIDSITGLLTNNGAIASGTYDITVYVQDTVKNQISAKITITVQDITPPMWNPPLENQNIKENEILAYKISATDNTAVDEYWINDTSNFFIDAKTGLLTYDTILVVGQYNLMVYVNDTEGNENNATLTITVYYDIPPSWDQEIEDQYGPFWSDFSYDVNASDNVAIDQYWLDSTTYFTIDTDGFITNSTTLQPGDYFMVVSANDTDGNTIYSGIKFTIVEDWDADGMPDGWEIDNGLDPNADDAGEDPDGDGKSNLEEFKNGNDPNEADSEDGGIARYLISILAGIGIIFIGLRLSKYRAKK